ncbi:hypothetical protein LCGC14_0428830 [marine sediment metagenome]|uniref:Uncharacterized protein n=1 Tax=marine sediment metagenome TaxID=412755 RepID=A0A0F9SNJ1_9ZZZZ
MSTVWRLSNNRMTVKVTIGKDHRIIDAAPIVRRFRGQPLINLSRWMERMGKTDLTLIGKPTENRTRGGR